MKAFFLLFIVLLLSIFSHIKILAGERIPMLDPLSLEQRKNYMQASPSGQDNPIINPVVSQPTIINTRSIPSEIEKNIAEKLTPVSLEEKIQQQVIQPRLEQFGYDLFNKIPTTFSPVTNIPVPMDYIIGPGDSIIVQLYGKTNVEYKLVVTREGQILIPDFGPVLVSGLTFSEVKDNLKNRFEKQIFGVKAAVTLAELRTINIMIVGDVINPGSYTLSGLTNLMNALLASGGIKRTGSLRKIQLKRNGKVVSRFDLYEVLLQGNTRSNIRLAHGDVIFVPAIGATVGVGGEVQRPAIYEIKGNSSLAQVIKLAGGLLPTASLKSSHIERIKQGQYHTLISLEQASLTLLNKEQANKHQTKKISIKAGDLIRIFPVKKQIDDVVLLSGHIMQPGGYQFKHNMRLSHLFNSYYQLRQNADTQFALLRRELRNQRRIETHYIDLKKVINHPGSQADIKLQRRDEIIFFDLAGNRAKRLLSLVQDLQTQSTRMYPPMIFSIKGYVRNSGTFPLQYAARLLDVFKISGEIKAGTDLAYVLIARKQFPDNQLELFSLDLNTARQKPHSEWNPIIHPEDVIYVFDRDIKREQLIQSPIQQLKNQTPYGQKSPVVSISGSINHQGDYPLEPGMRIDKLIRAAGGLNERSYGIQAELTRYQLVAGQFQISEQQQIDLQSIIATDSLTEKSNSRNSANIVLQAHDHLSIHKKPQWRAKRTIELAGEVKFPGQYPFNHNETLCHVLQRAGGLTNRAYPFGSVFTRQSVQKKQQKSLDKVQGELDDLLVKLHLSPSLNNDEKMPADEEMHEINSVIKKLKKARASGRMAINMDKIRQCDQQADILLEDGDKLIVPVLAYEVSVFGEVYQSATHRYEKSRGSQDYIDLSGGSTVLGKNDHAYVVQANGEVVSIRQNSLFNLGWFNSSSNIEVKPGASIYVPINVDRSNNRESLQSWASILFRLTLSAAGISAML
ncbi:MAG: SLBB domain-containing protein [gamma proteobacterium symbiont of Taylorina sp.]|nr:SLBB domain-containing protein [gamma proteobacterium symbiont of Taylorina sp.]